MEDRRVLIDTSILIDHLRKTRKDSTLFYEVAQKNECLISSITEFEFSVASTLKNREFSEKLLKNLSVLPFDSNCVRIAVVIYHDLKSKNKLISLPDIFIAATAVVNNLSLVTLNLKHFENIDKLQLQPK